MGESRDILQSLYTKIDTCETGWMAFAKTCIPPYDDAFNTHTKTLKAVSQAIKLEAEQGWMVLSMVLSIAGGYWVGKFLEPVGGLTDELVGKWIKVTISEGTKHFVTEVGKEVYKNMQDTLLDNLKNNTQGIISDPYEPVVESTVVWNARLEEGILKRSYTLKKGVEEWIKNADNWSVPAAEFLKNSFLNYCPFITDVPEDMEDAFKIDFRRLAELTMWRAWGIARDENWWTKNPNDSSIFLMGPIFDRMVSLGVSPSDVANNMGWTSMYRRPGWRFDMVKFIGWSKRVNLKSLAGKAKTKAEPPEQVCKAVDLKLFLRRNVNACFPGDIR